MNEWYSVVSQRANHRCEYCHAPEVVFNFPLEVEHIVPLKSGGLSGFDNFALACRSCNLFKSMHLVATDPLSKESVPLFDPRRQVGCQSAGKTRQ